MKAVMRPRDEYHRALLRRFVDMMALYPIGALAWLNVGEPGIVRREHRSGPFRPQFERGQGTTGLILEQPVLANTWERDDRGDFPLAIVAAVDLEGAGIDPLSYFDQHGSEQSR